jgi:hypothetical protein
MTPDVTLEDGSTNYGKSTDINDEGHFELQFGPGQIALAPGH